VTGPSDNPTPTTHTRLCTAAKLAATARRAGGSGRTVV